MNTYEIEYKIYEAKIRLKGTEDADEIKYWKDRIEELEDKLESLEENAIDRCDLDEDDYSDEEWYTA